MVEREYSYGIYMFKDKKTNKIDYIGLDSHIDRRERIKAHYIQSQYGGQPFNRALQNNPDRFVPFVYCKCDTYEEMCQLEFDLINLYRPRFNYKHGGGGSYINREFQYTVVKDGLCYGKQKYSIQGMNRKALKTSVDFEFLQDICLKLNKNELTPDDVKNIEREIVPSLQDNLKKSRGRNASGFFRVRKHPDPTCKQGFLWKYEYYENKKHKKISRVDLFDLEKVVKSRGLHWEILDVEKARESIKINGG